MPGFETRGQIDKWYRDAMVGLAKALVTNAERGIVSEIATGPTDYDIIITLIAHNLDKLKPQAYLQLGIPEPAELISLGELAKRYSFRRILDASQIDMDDPTIRHELDLDLKRMDELPHDEVPGSADAYRVTVSPSTVSYMPGFYRFVFEIQYGKLEDDEFTPIGTPIRQQSETLPHLD
jgi:hypothetical protein